MTTSALETIQTGNDIYFAAMKRNRTPQAALIQVSNELADAQRTIRDHEAALAGLYRSGQATLIARMCDEVLDRSGALLGRVRELARA